MGDIPPICDERRNNSMKLMKNGPRLLDIKFDAEDNHWPLEQSPFPFQKFPVRIITEILKDVSVNDLKSLRLVNWFWNQVISDTEILAEKSDAVVYDGADDKSLKLLRNSKIFNFICPFPCHSVRCFWIVRCFGRKYSLHGKTFRIVNTICLEEPLRWINSFKFKKCITELEIETTRIELLGIPHLKTWMSKFLNRLESLTLTDVRFTDMHGRWWDELYVKPTFKSLKNLNINFNHPWTLQHLLLPKFLTDLIIFPRLESLIIRMYDTGKADLDRRGHFEMLFKSIGLILKNNAKTLKKLVVITFDKYVDLIHRSFVLNDVTNVKITEANKPTIEHNFEFECFLQEMSDGRWNEYDLQLKHLTLEFRVMILGLNGKYISDKTLKAFLESMSSTLRDVSLGQIYTRNRKSFYDTFGRILLLPHCQCNFVEVYDILPFQLQLQGPNLGFLEVYGIPKEQIVTTAKLFKERSDIYNNETSAKLTAENVQWIVRYPKWKSILEVDFYKRNVSLFTKIRIDQLNSPLKERTVITDDTLQTIWRSACSLKFLWLCCNLLEVTDYGLTGILPREDEAFRTGIPVSNLKKLNLVLLDGIGRKLTTISKRYSGARKVEFYIKDIPNMESIERVKLICDDTH